MPSSIVSQPKSRASATMWRTMRCLVSSSRTPSRRMLLILMNEGRMRLIVPQVRIGGAVIVQREADAGSAKLVEGLEARVVAESRALGDLEHDAIRAPDSLRGRGRDDAGTSLRVAEREGIDVDEDECRSPEQRGRFDGADHGDVQLGRARRGARRTRTACRSRAAHPPRTRVSASYAKARHPVRPWTRSAGRPFDRFSPRGSRRSTGCG